MRTYEKTYFRGVGDNYMSGLPLPDDNGYIGYSRFIGCRFHPECARAVFEHCTFIDCTGLPYLNLDSAVITCSSSIDGLPLDIAPEIMFQGEIIEYLKQSENMYRRLYRSCAIRHFENGPYWPAMSDVLVVRYDAED